VKQKLALPFLSFSIATIATPNPPIPKTTATHKHTINHLFVLLPAFSFSRFRARFHE